MRQGEILRVRRGIGGGDGKETAVREAIDRPKEK